MAEKRPKKNSCSSGRKEPKAKKAKLQAGVIFLVAFLANSHFFPKPRPLSSARHGEVWESQ
jgi:hypothetical protein